PTARQPSAPLPAGRRMPTAFVISERVPSFRFDFLEPFLEPAHERRERLAPVADDPDVGRLEDRCPLVDVQGDDDPGLHGADQMLERPADTDGDIEAGRDGAAGESDLTILRQPAGVGDRARGADGGAETLRERLDLRT